MMTQGGKINYRLAQLHAVKDFVDSINLDEYETRAEKIWALIHDIPIRPRCPCGMLTKFNRTSIGYFKTCSINCSAKQTARGKDCNLASKEYLALIKDRVHKGTFHTQKKSVKTKIKIANAKTYRDRYLPSRLEKLQETGFTLLSDFERFSPTKWIHKCGTIFNDIPNSRFEIICPRCKSAGISLPHQLLINRLIDDGFKLKINDRQLIKPKELDIVIDDKIAIEVNGIYYHNDNCLDKDYHRVKLAAALEKGIRLFQFWDYEILTKTEIVIDIIESSLGRSKRIFARQCEVRFVDSLSARKFVEENHLSGCSANFSTAHGLYHKDELVSILLSGTPRFGKDRSGIEIIRFCSKLGFSVIGGFSKLVKQLGNKRIISYQDGRLGYGTMYESAGFIFQKQISANYSYMKGKQHLSRQQAMKNKLGKLLGDAFDSSLTEKENMRNAGWLICYDAGHKQWIKEANT